jgi:AcrR family transcriptional regulator
MGGLRERKKQRTRDTIARVALELFDEQGFRATTIPQIAEAADVAPRTVSAYFPAKEDLVFPDMAVTLARLSERLAARRPGESALEALRGWVVAELPGWQERDDEMRIRRRVVATDEALRSHERRFIGRVQELMAAAIADDVGESADDVVPRMAAAATAAILEGLGHHGDEGLDDAVALIDGVVTFVDAGIHAVRSGATP